ncbi:flagellar motor protein MotD [Noviherbaspirillum cavernae]|uniref:Flagellar motor protein MotD n=1 Tax=Noviherbaspirillum cavernae TaxID=2320862 RepID=A0A418X0C4_9BURK|nr:flagellar motor protein MotD [Noviherbaspirillum cavernae]RJG05930.1 flagellar motor protein MotD [Noviherbaspirillum cavernae]
MPRKRYEEEPDNHDRWMVSYADFITLLFAFFVVMYAISSVNDGKYRVLSSSLISAFSNGTKPLIINDDNRPQPPVQIAPPSQKRQGEALRREREHMTRIARDILTVLAPLIDQGKVRVTQTDRGVKVEINASVLFAPGDARLAVESSEALKAVAAVLKDDVRAIQVEGHTDSVPIRNALFASNWELSAVRASSVVRLFIDNGVAESRLTAVGRGSTQAVGDNDTADGRQRNRRVAVIIMSSLPETVTDVQVEAGPVK